MKPEIDYSLYLVTNRDLMSASSLETAVEQAIIGGCTVVQLREKSVSSMKFYQIAKDVKSVTDCYDLPLIINDRVDIALAVDAAGVHIGQSDLPAEIVRKMIGDEKILGVSASNLQEAVKAQEDGADYLGVGAMFATDTKTDAVLVSREELLVIRRTISVPIVVIGGINDTTVSQFCGTGINGVAVVSAIISQPDIKNAAKEMKTLLHF